MVDRASWAALLISKPEQEKVIPGAEWEHGCVMRWLFSEEVVLSFFCRTGLIYSFHIDIIPLVFMGIALSWQENLGSCPVSELHDCIGVFLVKSHTNQM